MTDATATLIERARFEMRFRWLEGHSVLDGVADWDVFVKERAEVVRLQVRTLKEETARRAMGKYDEALVALDELQELVEKRVPPSRATAENTRVCPLPPVHETATF